jgi:preprotein translocase subunit SecG
LTAKQDTIAVEKQTSFLTVLELPSTAKPGDYIVFGRVRYGNNVASGSDSFKAVSKEEIGTDKIMLYSQIVIIFILFMIVVLVLNLYKKRRGKHKSLTNRLMEELESMELRFKDGSIDEIEYHEKKAVLLKKLKRVDKKRKGILEESVVETIEKLKEGM